MLFDEFKTTVEAAGLEARECSSDHWQIRGGANVVNFYPHTRRGSRIYINGMVRGERAMTAGLDEAIRAATTAPARRRYGTKAKRGSIERYRRWKRRRCEERARCHWCGCVVSCDPPEGVERASVDHRIPLARGGLDNPNNWVLACEPCNRRRGSNMPELKKKRKGARSDVPHTPA